MENRIGMDKEEKYPFPTLEELKAEIPEEDPTRLYLDEIGHLEILSEQEEQDLARRMLEGDEEAREKLIEHNLLRAAFISMQYRGRGLHVLDIMQEANKGLLKAVKEYREMEKYPFFAFAAWHIHMAIHREFQMATIDYRHPFDFVKIDSERVLKNPAFFWKCMEKPRHRIVNKLDWALITMIFGLNGGRKLTDREILDITGASAEQLEEAKDEAARGQIVFRY